MANQVEKKITIDDVAKLCGVSKSTISRYLNGRNEGFSEATRERIHKVITELDYRPDRTAQRLKSVKSKLIGCVLADVSSPFSAMLLKGIMGVCEGAGYQVLFTDCCEDSKREVQAIEGLLTSRVDGVIVNTSGENDEFLASVKKRGVPIVLADRGLLSGQRLDTIEHENEKSAYDCVKLLSEYGYTRIAFFTQGNKRVAPRVLRYEGYKKGVREFFPQQEPEMYAFDNADVDKCVKQLRAFRDAYPDERIAIISANGVTTRDLLLAMNQTEYVWGKDYGLCSYDDWEWFQLSSPGITSICLPSQEIGERAAALLIEYIANVRSIEDQPLDIKLPGKLNIRGSTIKVTPK